MNKKVSNPSPAFSLPKEAGTCNLNTKNIQNLDGGNFSRKNKSSWFIFDQSWSLLAWAKPSLKLDRRSPCHSLGNWLQDIYGLRTCLKLWVDTELHLYQYLKLAKTSSRIQAILRAELFVPSISNVRCVRGTWRSRPPAASMPLTWVATASNLKSSIFKNISISFHLQSFATSKGRWFVDTIFGK